VGTSELGICSEDKLLRNKDVGNKRYLSQLKCTSVHGAKDADSILPPVHENSSENTDMISQKCTTSA
jgi:hypothetical protein